MAKKIEFQERLKRYTDLLQEIRIAERRKNAMPTSGDLIQRRALAGVCDDLRALLEKEAAEYESLIKIIDKLQRVDERQVLMARYMDGQPWQIIAAALFDDFIENEDKQQNYLRRVFRLHGSALTHANRIMLQHYAERK